MEGDVISMQDLFLFKQEGYDENGKVVGSFTPTGLIPRFFEDLRARGVQINLDIFQSH